MKEQTQEPVEGMEELTDKFIQTIAGRCEHESYCQSEECKLKGVTVCFLEQEEAKQCAKIAFEYFTSPPEPIKTEGEDKKENPQNVLHDNIKGIAGLNDLTIWHKEFIYKAMRAIIALNDIRQTAFDALNKISKR